MLYKYGHFAEQKERVVVITEVLLWCWQVFEG